MATAPCKWPWVWGRTFGLACLFPLLGPALAVFADEHAEVLQRIEQAQAENAKRYFYNITSTTVQNLHDDKGAIFKKYVHDFKSNDRCFLLHSKLQKLGAAEPDKPDEIWVGRPEASYRILQKERGYIVAGAWPPTPEARESICQVEKGIGMPFGLMGCDIATYFRLPDLTVRGQSVTVWNGRSLTRVLTHRTIRGGVDHVFYFDHNHGWIMDGNELIAPKKGVIATSRVFYEADGTTPKRWEYWIRSKEGGQVLAHSVDVLSFQREAHADEEFHLTQFGLPDPDAPRQARMRFSWLWFAGFGCLLLALLFAGLKRWSQRRKPLVTSG